MKQIIIPKTFSSDEEYFLFEEKSEVKHEFVNGNLIEISGANKYHNKITLQTALLLKNILKQTNWEIFINGYKVKNVDGNYFYPDLIISHPDTETYFTEQPILIVEVLSETTRKYDLTDKFIQYQKINTLHYYLCVESEQQVIIFYFKNNDGEWMTETYTRDEDILQLNQLGISFTLQQIYKL